jgi:membrane protein
MGRDERTGFPFAPAGTGARLDRAIFPARKVAGRSARAAAARIEPCGNGGVLKSAAELRPRPRSRAWAKAAWLQAPPGLRPGPLARRVWRRSGADDCLGLAAQMAYFFALAIFPSFIFLAALVGYLPVTPFWRDFVDWVTRVFPPDAQTLIVKTVLGLTASRRGFISIGFAGATWAAATGVVMLIRGLDAVYEIPETRSLWKLFGRAVVMLFVLSFFFLSAFALFAAGDRLDLWLAAQFGPHFHAERMGDLIRAALYAVVLNFGVVLTNYALPNGKRPWRWVTAGSVFVVVASVPVLAGFGFYVAHFSYYPRMYGALGAFVIFMVWTYLASLILLVGAELDAEMARLSRQRAAATAPAHT